MDEPIFEFTFEGKHFQIYDDGYVKIIPSKFGPDAQIVVNRIPSRLLKDPKIICPEPA